jgi:multidrug efflux pump subunit AcrB
VTLTGLLALVVTPREYNPQIVVPAANIIVAKPGRRPPRSIIWWSSRWKRS